MTQLVATRQSLHAVAEQVLAPALHHATGRIGLRAAPGGFATPWFPLDGGGERRIRVDGTDIVVETRGAGEEDLLREPLTTLRAAAAFVGIEPGAPAGVYRPATTLSPDVPLVLDPRAAADLARFFAAGDEALAQFAAELPSPLPVAQLWPEHFDLGISAEEINYGASPGDDATTSRTSTWGRGRGRRAKPFWNESFGASRTWEQAGDVAGAVELFREGRAHALGPLSD